MFPGSRSMNTSSSNFDGGDAKKYTYKGGYNCFGLNPRNKDAVLAKGTQLKSVTRFSRKQLLVATDNFSKKVDECNYFISYRGVLKDGAIVAVKKIKDFRENDVEFFSFVSMMSTIRHRNVDRLLGYCFEGNTKMLVYKFVDYDSLARVFSDGFRLSWSDRASICKKIARAIDYLHHGISPPVVHGDIHPANILLNSDFDPVIAFFEKAYLSKNAADFSYLQKADNEHWDRAKFPEARDVYCFGMLLFTIISGKVLKDVEMVHKFRDCIARGMIKEVIDPNLYDFPNDEIVYCADVASLCVSEDPLVSPSMSEVLHMLFPRKYVLKQSITRPAFNWAPTTDDLVPHSTLSDNVKPANFDEIITAEVEDGSLAESGPSKMPMGKIATGYQGEIQIENDNVDTQNEISNDREYERSPEARRSNTISSTASSVWSTITLPQRMISYKFETVFNNLEPGDVFPLPEVRIKRPTRKTLVKILGCLKQAQSISGKIWLHGKPGSGKTTVLRTLMHHPATTDLFDLIIYVNVSSYDYQIILKNEILRHLSIDVQDSDSETEISYKIRQALNCKKVLVLADEFHESVDLYEVGIPNSGPENSCWLIFSTATSDIWSGKGYIADWQVEMELLSDMEALELFSSQVAEIGEDYDDYNHNIKEYSQTISKSCQGLPLLITAVGSALRKESRLEEWVNAVRNLASSDASGTNVHSSGNPHIKFCYDRLNDRDAKTCFLCSALFLNEIGMNVSELIECFVNEGLLSGSTTHVYRKGYNIVTQLVDASLLEMNDSGVKVKMHRVIRDSALAILASEVEGFQLLARSQLSQTVVPKFEKDDQSIGQDITADTHNNDGLTRIDKYLVRVGAELKEAPPLSEWEQASMIFLMDNELTTLPNKPGCSNLVALFLQRNNCLRVLPASFFETMFSLTILNLSKTKIRCLPESFSLLPNLQVLLLRECEQLLTLPPSIGLHKFLEVLDLQGTELTHLPDSVLELIKLKLLRVSFYGSMNQVEYSKLPVKLVKDGIISSRYELKELGLFVHPGDPRWTTCVSNITKEVSKLEVSALCFYFVEITNLDYFVKNSLSWLKESLSTFNFTVGRDFKRLVPMVSDDAVSMYDGAERCLRFVNGEHIADSVVMVLKHATAFYLDHHLGIHCLSEFGIHSMKVLKICIVSDCPELVSIIDNRDSNGAFLSALEYLSINFLWELERIWVGKISRGSFSELRHLSVNACPKLKYLLTCSMLFNLRNLEELEIEDCASLEDVVVEEDNASNEQIRGREIPVLCELKVLKLHYIPNLRCIWKAGWPSVEYISFHHCPELKNLHMNFDDQRSIKEMLVDRSWWDDLIWDDPQLCTLLSNRVKPYQDS